MEGFCTFYFISGATSQANIQNLNQVIKKCAITRKEENDNLI